MSCTPLHKNQKWLISTVPSNHCCTLRKLLKECSSNHIKIKTKRNNINVDGNKFIFWDFLESCSVDEYYAVNELTKTRKKTVISSSIKWKENFSTFKCHDLSYTCYTSKDKIKRNLKKQMKNHLMVPQESV